MAGTSSTAAPNRVLAGRGSYDELPAEAQTLVRARWDTQLAEKLSALTLADVIADADTPYVTAAPDGTPVINQPPSAAEPDRTMRREAKLAADEPQNAAESARVLADMDAVEAIWPTD